MNADSVQINRRTRPPRFDERHRRPGRRRGRPSPSPGTGTGTVLPLPVVVAPEHVFGRHIVRVLRLVRPHVPGTHRRRLVVIRIIIRILIRQPIVRWLFRLYGHQRIIPPDRQRVVRVGRVLPNRLKPRRRPRAVSCSHLRARPFSMPSHTDTPEYRHTGVPGSRGACRRRAPPTPRTATHGMKKGTS